MTTANDNNDLDDAKLERISQRVADLLFDKLLTRLAGGAATPTSAISTAAPKREVKLTAAGFAALNERRRRLGRGERKE